MRTGYKNLWNFPRHPKRRRKKKPVVLAPAAVEVPGLGKCRLVIPSQVRRLPAGNFVVVINDRDAYEKASRTKIEAQAEFAAVCKAVGFPEGRPRKNAESDSAFSTLSDFCRSLTPAERHVRFVRHARIEAYLACGWIVGFDLGPTHGEWSVGMVWLCGCQLREPGAMPDWV
jgi:hypothetical protein